MSNPTSTQTNFTAESNELELQKRRLEIEKLRAEIQHVSEAWWKRPGYLGVLTPILVAIIAAASAWSAGFFDTQRARLKSEIQNLQLQKENLENQKTQLVNSNAAIQATIDEAYLTLKRAVADAEYAFSHLRASGPALSDAERQSVQATARDASQPVRGHIERLLQMEANNALILPIIEKEFPTLKKKLASMPASKWAIELEPEIGPRSVFRAPNGKLYDPVSRKFYDTMADYEKREAR